jgi:hypothetical protein
MDSVSRAGQIRKILAVIVTSLSGVKSGIELETPVQVMYKAKFYLLVI